MKEKLCTMKKKIQQQDIGKNVLFPVYQSDLDIIAKVKDGTQLLVNTEKHRNPKFHKLAFALANLIIDNIPEDHEFFEFIKIMTAYDLIKQLMWKHKFVELKLRINGDPFFEVKSLKFEKMNDEEFKTVWDILVAEGSEILKIPEIELRENYERYL